MRVILFGATGMVGSAALIECLTDARVTSVVSVVRRASGAADPKVTELVHRDFFDFSPIQTHFAGAGACFFCLGVSAAGMSEADYSHLTYDLTLAAAQSIVAVSPGATFCYVSGAATDSTERGRMMWARVKGRTENALRALPFRAAYMFRPGFIQPTKGVRSSTKLYQVFYVALAPISPVLRRLFPRVVTTSEELGRALIEVSVSGYSKPILETEDINRVGHTTR